MEAKILGSGSDGNCVLLKDIENNELLLDCGVPMSVIAKNISIKNLIAVLVTHEHKDHSLSYDNFKYLGVKRFCQDDFENGKIIQIGCWKILAIELKHNVKCFGYLIFNMIEKKKIAYITDTTFIPELSNLDLFILDVNYCENVIFEYSCRNEKFNLGCKNHNSLENTIRYFERRPRKVKNFVAYHLSNSGLNNKNLIKEKLGKYTDNLYIAKNNLKVLF